MSGHPFCKDCRSHFRPHVARHLYKKDEAERYLAELRKKKLEPGS